DFIPDALSVVYFYAIGNEFEFSLAFLSVSAPGNLNMLKKGVGSAADAVSAINKGEELLKEGQNLVSLRQEVNQVATVFKIKPSDIDLTLGQKIIDKVPETKSLLTTDP